MRKIFMIILILVAVATTLAWGLQTDAVPEGAVPAPEETKMSNPSPTPDPIPSQVAPKRGDRERRYTNVRPENDKRTGWNLRVPPATKVPQGLKPTQVESPKGHETIVMGRDKNPPIRIVRVGTPEPTAITTVTATPVESPKGHETIVVDGSKKPAPAPAAPEKKEKLHPGLIILIIVGAVFLIGFLNQNS